MFCAFRNRFTALTLTSVSVELLFAWTRQDIWTFALTSLGVESLLALTWQYLWTATLAAIRVHSLAWWAFLVFIATNALAPYVIKILCCCAFRQWCAAPTLASLWV